MSCAKSFTRGDVDFDAASLPASISTWLAVTTIAAICASLGRSAAPAAAKASTPASTDNDIFIAILLSKSTAIGDVRTAGASMAHDNGCHDDGRRSRFA